MSDTSVQKYVAKPQYFEAIKWDGNNLETVKSFMGSSFSHTTTQRHPGGQSFIVGYMDDISGFSFTVPKGDYVVKDEQGSYGMLRAEFFETQYQRVE